MKNTYFALFLGLFLALGINNAQAHTSDPTPEVFPTCDDGVLRTVTLKEGEPIYLELMNDYDVDKMEIGNTVQFRVTSNVLVDNKEVIRAFTTAVGVVSRVEGTTNNTNGKIQLTVRHIRAVDGSQVLVDGPANLISPQIGTQVMVYVKNAIDIEVR